MLKNLTPEEVDFLLGEAKTCLRIGREGAKEGTSRAMVAGLVQPILTRLGVDPEEIGTTAAELEGLAQAGYLPAAREELAKLWGAWRLGLNMAGRMVRHYLALAGAALEDIGTTEEGLTRLEAAEARRSAEEFPPRETGETDDRC